MEGRHLGDHVLAQVIDVPLLGLALLPAVGAQEGGHDVQGQGGAEQTVDLQHLHLRGQGEAIAALALDGGGAGDHHVPHPALGAGGQLLHGHVSGHVDGGIDAGGDAELGQGLGPGVGELDGILRHPGAAEHHVGVAVDKARADDLALGVDVLDVLDALHILVHVGFGADGLDEVALDIDGAALQHPHVVVALPLHGQDLLGVFNEQLGDGLFFFDHMAFPP